MSKTILILLGPSGCGKTTIGIELKKKGIPEVISHTTRPMREGEIDGVTYNFVTKKEFDTIDKIEEVEYTGNHYCVSREEIEKKLSANNTIFVITDIEGVKQIRKRYPKETKVVFIFEDVDVLKDRMRKRGDNEKNIELRVKKMIDSKEHENEKYADISMKNDSIKDTVKSIEKFIRKIK